MRVLISEDLETDERVFEIRVTRSDILKGEHEDKDLRRGPFEERVTSLLDWLFAVAVAVDRSHTRDVRSTG